MLASNVRNVPLEILRPTLLWGGQMWVNHAAAVRDLRAAWELARRALADTSYGAPRPAALVAAALPVFDEALIDALWDDPDTWVFLLGNPAMEATTRLALRLRLVHLSRYANDDRGINALQRDVAAEGHAPLESPVLDALLGLAVQSPRRRAIGEQAAECLLASPGTTVEHLELLAEEYVDFESVEMGILRHGNCPLTLAHHYAQYLADGAAYRGARLATASAGIIRGLAKRPDFLADPEVRDTAAPAAAVSDTLARAYFETAGSSVERWHWFEVWATRAPRAAFEFATAALAAGEPIPRSALTPFFCADDADLRERAALELPPLATHAPSSPAELPEDAPPPATMQEFRFQAARRRS